MIVDAAATLRSLLRTNTPRANARWRRWAVDLMEPAGLTAPLLTALWREICDFDEWLARYIARPLAVPDRTVVVA
ncbi:MAG: hypothetical protein ACRDQA_24975, partial [Nocardioidaceae bacterium]